MDEYYRKLFSRNIGIFTEQEQKELGGFCVAIAGVGGVGGIQIVNLARAGIGKFIIADPENFGHSDRNRQYGAYESTLHLNKAKVMKQIIKDINPNAEITCLENGVNMSTMTDFVKGADVVIDAIEYFSIAEKNMLHNEARKYDKFVFTSPIIGFGASLLVFDPKGISFEEYFQLDKGAEKLDFFKLCPKYPEYLDKDLYNQAINKDRPIPSFSTSSCISGALLAANVVLFLLGKKKPVIAPEFIWLDVFGPEIIIKGKNE